MYHIQRMRLTNYFPHNSGLAQQKEKYRRVIVSANYSYLCAACEVTWKAQVVEVRAGTIF